MMIKHSVGVKVGVYVADGVQVATIAAAKYVDRL